MRNSTLLRFSLGPALATTLVLGCAEHDPAATLDGSTAGTGSDADAGADADYQTVFGDGQVLRLELRIAAEDWAAMWADMTDMAGEFGAQPGPPGGIAPGAGPFGGPIDGLPAQAQAACEDHAQGATCSFEIDGQEASGTCEPLNGELVCAAGVMIGDGGPGGDDIGDFLPRTPIWKPCTVVHEGRTFQHVGVRFKGNSTLVNTWSRGIYKLPLRLRFDKFGDEHPETAEQRFFGFQSLSLTNNVSDPSYLREKVVADLLRKAGVPAARTAFARVYIDTGDGPTYFGLYTLVEVPDEPLFDSQLGGGGGNLYKPEGEGARFTRFVPEDFEKENNERANDYSDVERAIAALHADRSDAARWRDQLEQQFDANGFLRWLAANTILGNWDVYGSLPHNYYLYGAPADGGRLHWIPWDHDLALGGSDLGSLLHEDKDESWPLIRFLLDDEVYRAVYLDAAREIVSGVLTGGEVRARLEAEHALIAPYVVGENGEAEGYHERAAPSDFAAALDGERGIVPIAESLAAQARAELGLDD